jgi:hypothetical protein
MDVRIFIVISIVLASATSALACPRGARCATGQPATRVELAQPARRALAAPTRTVTLTVARTQRAPDRARWTQRDLPTRATSQASLVWQAVRTKVAAKLPTYRTSNGRSITLSPVVVFSDAFDAAPCIGISGGF